MEIVITALYIIACVLLFALAILVHEFGHFIVAVKLGFKVEAFSIGFGPAIWKKTWRGVEYRISLIPLGGYVSIPDVDPEGTKAIEGAKPSSQVKKVHPAWKELLVAVAGPAMNIVLAVVLALVLSLAPGARFGQIPAIIGDVYPGGPAHKSGMKVADRVLSVGGRAVSTWTQMQTEVQISGGKPTVFEVERSSGKESLTIIPERDAITGAYLIKALSTTNHAGAVAWMPERNPLKQLAWDAGSIFRILKGLVTPKEVKATSQALGGPVMIAEGIYRSMRKSPWDGIGFLRFLNVNLAILNLLPIPVLDGGLIFFSLIALVFRRRVPDFIVKHLSLVFMVILMGLMGILVIKDSWRSYKIHSSLTEAANVQTDTNQNSESRQP